MKQPKQKKSWLDLIKYVFSFFFSKRKEEKEEEEAHFEEVNDDLKDTYEEIDDKFEKEKGKSTKERLENLF